ncbi:MAG TPA: hypothetical protein VF880_07175 [Actinomycetes bacterium]
MRPSSATAPSTVRPSTPPPASWARRPAEALGNRIQQVDLGYWRARMLLDRDRPGDRDAAAAQAAEVAGRYRELGLRRHAEAAAALVEAEGRGRHA